MRDTFYVLRFYPMHPKHLLDQHGLEPKKSLGQNFLFDENVLERIAGAAEVGPGDQVLEIGPGLGSLTRMLAQTAERVVAVELDERLLPVLEAELEPYDNVEVIHGDILEQDPGALFEGSYKVVANLPYYITGAILRHLLSAAHKPALMVLTVQKEVAERLTAEPPNMSLLAVSVQFYGQAKVVDTIKAGAFWPRPEVDSAVVRIDLRNRTRMNADDTDQKQRLLSVSPVNEEAFFELVRAGFSQKRKQLQSNLRQLGYSKAQIEQALKEAEVDGRRRAETLSLGEWLGVYNSLENNRRPATGDRRPATG